MATLTKASRPEEDHVSSAPHLPPDQPLIPMPNLTFPALRQAVATLVPARLPELFEEMQQAFTWAAEENSLGPIRLFQRRWGTVVAIERIPSRAAPVPVGRAPGQSTSRPPCLWRWHAAAE